MPISATEKPDVPNCPDKLFTWEEISKHTSESDLWVVIHGYVCKVSDFLDEHPGGLDPIWQMGGQDATNLFYSIAGHHRSGRAVAEWQKRVIGRVDPTSTKPVVVRKKAVEKAPVRYSTWGPLIAVAVPAACAIAILQFLEGIPLMLAFIVLAVCVKYGVLAAVTARLFS